LGIVRTVSVPNVVIDEKTGKPTEESLNKALKVISDKSGHGTESTWTYIKDDHFKEMNDYAAGRMKENQNPNRDSYDHFSNNCGHFMQDVIDAGGLKTPIMIDPRPNSYIDELKKFNFVPKEKKE
jgi:hypothetical protein